MFKKKMIEKKNALITRAEEIVAKAKAEERELTEDEAKTLDEIDQNVKSIKTTIEATDKVEAMDDKEEAPADEDREDETEKTEDEKAKEEQETRAFENYIRGVVVNERAGELTKGDNGAVIPTSIANKIIKKVYDISPVLERSDRYNVKGQLNIPYYDTTSGDITVAYQTEFTALTSSNGKFATISLTGFLAGALSKISRSLINNAQFDIVDFVVTQMAENIARFIEKELLVGTSGKVTGMSTLTNGVTATAATYYNADDLIKLKDAVKDVYQNNAIFVMNSKTRTALRLLKDDNGRYLLQDDITSPFGTTLLGKPVYVSDNMPETAASKATIYYGDFKGLATKFSEDINIQVLREKYADEHAVGVIGWFEFDSKVENEQMLAKLTMAAADPAAAAQTMAAKTTTASK
ncbi:phage major capsid protein [Megamonas hypermegale]|uniref:phage major capsid protein n=1 Tax=Megamonas hypermegale TaxID=158847 RepID=UPI0026EA29E2|nr:phage major capsid protein [Megamonas hypermegale]